MYAAPVRVTQYRIEGLGHLSTLVVDEAGGVAAVAAVVAVADPRRNAAVYLEAAAAEDFRTAHVSETHLHNDDANP